MDPQVAMLCCGLFPDAKEGQGDDPPLLMLATSAKVLSRGGKKGAGYSIAGGL